MELQGPARADTPPRIDFYGQRPISFEENRGQTDSEVRFISRGEGFTLFLNRSGATLLLSRAERGEKEKIGGPVQAKMIAPAVVRMTVNGADFKAKIVGRELLSGKSNYLIGNDPKKWKRDLPTYGKVQYEEIYPGIDLVYYGNQRELEFDFVLRPGADPEKIDLKFEGADRLEVDSDGALVIRIPGGRLFLRKPVLYQLHDVEKRPISGRYALEGKNSVRFEVAAYDKKRALVIDPVLSYATYLGGNGEDLGRAIAADAAGNVYLTGRTTSANFPTKSPFQGAPFPCRFSPGCSDIFVTRFDPSGAIVYSTYLGGEQDDEGRAIAVDRSGNVYLAGKTYSGNFPTTPGAVQTVLRGRADVFVSKLSPDGGRLLYSTYLGGEGDDYKNLGDDEANGVAVDSAGNAYVTGVAESLQFPTTPGAFQSINPAGDPRFSLNVFAAKLNPSATALIYATYIGGRRDIGNAIAVDGAGNTFIAGWATENFPTTPNAFKKEGGVWGMDL